ncbi:MAG TPA: TIGR01777 family oxidoreductase [Bryobacteraceae bacterium]|nr:TIGR01777 family oxidoreductase [Bryobacteraceae bacterium]
MKCIVSGGTGFIGRRIVDRLLADRHYVGVWSRTPGREKRIGVASFSWDPLQNEPPEESLRTMDAVIHLAGEPVAQRWNTEVKRRIRDSRVLGTRRLVDVIARVPHKPKVLVCASAIGIYGDRGDEILTESSKPGSGFLADVCRAWEAEADRAAYFGLRVVKLRIGFVLGADGGALAQMIPAFRAFLGGRLGSGRQWMPWIHADDVAELFVHAAENEAISGVWNATSPNPVTNGVFTRELASTLHRPALLPVPPIALRLAFGELAQHMLDSARVVPECALKAGFRFRYPDLAPALRNLLDQ